MWPSNLYNQTGLVLSDYSLDCLLVKDLDTHEAP